MASAAAAAHLRLHAAKALERADDERAEVVVELGCRKHSVAQPLLRRPHVPPHPHLHAHAA